MLYGEYYHPKKYDYLFMKMPRIHQSLLEMHFTLYEGYVKQVNALNKMLRQLESTSFSEHTFLYQSIKRQYGWEYDGMVLHEMYFDNLGGNGEANYRSPVAKKLIDQFGSVENWQNSFKELAQMRGIGWVVLYYDPDNKEFKNVWIQDHSRGLLVNGIPIIVIDLWEHAYITEFGLNRMAYMDMMFAYLNWEVINNRFMQAAH